MLNIQNWGYYEPSIKGNLGLQLMSSTADRSTRPFLSGRDHPIMFAPNGTLHTGDCAVTEVPLHLDYMKDNWVSPREKFFNILPGNPTYGFNELPTTSQMQVSQPSHMVKEELESIEDPTVGNGKNGGIVKKRRGDSNTPKAPKSKKSKKGTSKGSEDRPVKKNVGLVINGIDMDISDIPIPVCSCTGVAQQCYRWGCGGWQSACCTTTISMYPLPLSTKRRGARIAGRKMSLGAFKKVLEKLGAEGYDFSEPIDLRTFWAKHGTNKFVTIR